MRLRTAVVGVGYLGRFHAQKYAALDASQLVAIADPSEAARERFGGRIGRSGLCRLPRAARPGGRRQHRHAHAVTFRHCPGISRGRCACAGGKADDRDGGEGASLVEIAKRAGRVLQVGHLERFNAAVQAVQPILTVPRFIESARLAPFKHRGTEVDVVLDLMIHDIDLILSIVRSPVIAVDAIGSSVFSKEIDIANARLRFANGCVANATASRVSFKTERKLRMFQDDAYLSVDLHQKVLTVIRKGEGLGADGMPQVDIDERTYEQGDALMAEIESFLQSAATGSPPAVSGEDGLLALRTAVDIADQVTSSLRQFATPDQLAGSMRGTRT